MHAVIPTGVRLNADPQFTGKGVTIAFLDSGFYPHRDLSERIRFYKDIARERASLNADDPTESRQWHGTQTSVVAAGDGTYRGLAYDAQVVLVKVSENARITEENIARGIKWVIANRECFNIRVLNIEDPSNGMKVVDGFGGLNSVLVIR